MKIHNIKVIRELIKSRPVNALCIDSKSYDLKNCRENFDSIRGSGKNEFWMVLEIEFCNKSPFYVVLGGTRNVIITIIFF